MITAVDAMGYLRELDAIPNFGSDMEAESVAYLTTGIVEGRQTFEVVLESVDWI
jgi:hypothetical protein